MKLCKQWPACDCVCRGFLPDEGPEVCCVEMQAREIEPRTQVSDAALAAGDRSAWKQVLGFPEEEWDK